MVLSIHLMFEGRVYSAKFRGLVLQLVHYQSPLGCGNHCHRVDLHIKVRKLREKKKVFNNPISKH